jgi:hypothetical protein
MPETSIVEQEVRNSCKTLIKNLKKRDSLRSLSLNRKIILKNRSQGIVV